MSEKARALRLKLLNWSIYMAVGASTPFILIYCKQIFTAEQGIPVLELIGVLFFLQPFFSIFANPLAGVLADKFRISHRILFFCAIWAFIGCVFIFIPGLPFFADVTQFWKALVIGTGIVLTGLFTNPIVPIINSETLDHLHNTGNAPGHFGKFRMYGSIAWVFITCFTGLILDLSHQIIISIALYGAGFIMLAVLSVTGIKAVVKPVKIPWHLLIKDKVYLLFLVFTFFDAFGLLSAYNFTSYFMDDLHFSYLAIGFAFGLSAIPEIPVMFHSEKIKQKLGSHKMIVWGSLILIAKILLVVLLSSYHSALLIILPMLLHGIGYGLHLNGIINFIDKRAHKHLKATYMTVYTVFGVGLARAFGNLFSAYIIEVLNSTWMLLLNAGIALLALLFFRVFIYKRGE